MSYDWVRKWYASRKGAVAVGRSVPEAYGDWVVAETGETVRKALEGILGFPMSVSKDGERFLLEWAGEDGKTGKVLISRRASMSA